MEDSNAEGEDRLEGGKLGKIHGSLHENSLLAEERKIERVERCWAFLVVDYYLNYSVIKSIFCTKKCSANEGICI